MIAASPDRQSLLQRRPLFGVPFAVKDNIDIAGVPTTAACPAFATCPDAIRRGCRAASNAGAVWLGKTNLDQFATGLVGTRSPYGQPACVFSAEHISGGSSSGSAIVVALGDVPFALGTDTAGSGRVPAAFNQIVGMKPTPGRVSTRGRRAGMPHARLRFGLCPRRPPMRAMCSRSSKATIPTTRSAVSNAGPHVCAEALRIGVPVAVRPSVLSAYAAPYAEACAHASALGHTLVPIDFDPLHERPNCCTPVLGSPSGTRSCSRCSSNRPRRSIRRCAQ